MTIEAAVSSIAERHLPGTGPPDVTATRHGGTSCVFRVSRAGSAVFVKLAEQPGEDMAVEGQVHDELRRRGVSVPEVVAIEPPGGALGRGAMVLTPMPGRSVLESRESSARIRDAIATAGRDLAVIGQIPVRGFGFVCRDAQPELRAGHPTARDLLLVPASASIERAGQTLGPVLADRARSVLVAHGPMLDSAESVLAHGDFDTTHIYVHDGAYAGIIDFGEIRGAPPLYDVAHFAVHEEQSPAAPVSALIDGYGAAGGLPAEHERRIAVLGTLIALRLAGIAVDRGQDRYAALLTRSIDRLTRSLARLA